MEWKNPDGQEFWNESFGEDKESVAKSDFVDAFENALGRLDAALRVPSFLSSIVDFALASGPSAEEITREDLDYFLCRFGSMTTCIPRVCKGLFDEYGILRPWYHGRIDKTEAGNLVRDAGNGAFVVRLSEKSLNFFAVTYMRPQGVQNSYIYTIPGGGYTMHKENFESKTKDFDTLADIMHDKKAAFVNEVPSSLYEDSAEIMDRTEKRNPYCANKRVDRHTHSSAHGNYDVGAPAEEAKGHSGANAYDALPNGSAAGRGGMSRADPAKSSTRNVNNYDTTTTTTRKVTSPAEPARSNYDAINPVGRAQTVSRIKMNRNEEHQDEAPSAYDAITRSGSVKQTNRRPVNRAGSNDVLQIARTDSLKKTDSTLSADELASISSYDVPAAAPKAAPKMRKQQSDGSDASAYESAAPSSSGINRRMARNPEPERPAAPAPAPEEEQHHSASNYDTTAPSAPTRRMKLQRKKQ